MLLSAFATLLNAGCACYATEWLRGHSPVRTAFSRAGLYIIKSFHQYKHCLSANLFSVPQS